MPELPEVQVVINYLNKNILNKEITHVDIYLTKLFKNIKPVDFIKKVVGLSFIEIKRRGKYLLFKLSNNSIMVSHLRMEGKYNYDTQVDKQKHDHVIFTFNDHTFLKYNDSRQFGTINFYKNEEIALKSKELAKLGLEPFSEEFNANYLYNLTKKSSKLIKTFLLDQTKVVGIGNIYANEICFACKIYPKTRANLLTKKQCELIVKETKRILHESVKHNGTTIHTFSFSKWDIGNYQDKLKVHEQKKCQLCGNKIIYEKINGRGTYYCKHCQKGK